MVLQGITTQVNITTVLAVIGTGSLLGGFIWKLATRISTLETKVDMNQTKTDSEIRHVLEVINLRLQISDDKDRQILVQLERLDKGLNEIKGNVNHLMTEDAITMAVRNDRRERKEKDSLG